jgi:hypothetical protein
MDIPLSTFNHGFSSHGPFAVRHESLTFEPRSLVIFQRLIQPYRAAKAFASWPPPLAASPSFAASKIHSCDFATIFKT